MGWPRPPWPAQAAVTAAAGSSPLLRFLSKAPKTYFSPPVTVALMGAGDRGICKAYNKPPAASRLTNVMLYFIITAAAATQPDLAVQIPHLIRQPGEEDPATSGGRWPFSDSDRCSAPAHGTGTHLAVGLGSARSFGVHSSLDAFAAVSPRNDPPPHLFACTREAI